MISSRSSVQILVLRWTFSVAVFRFLRAFVELCEKRDVAGYYSRTARCAGRRVLLALTLMLTPTN